MIISCQNDCGHPIETHSSRGCEVPGCRCAWVPLDRVLQRILPQEKENELRERLGSVSLAYEGPMLTHTTIRQVERGVNMVLDRMGIAKDAPATAAIMASTIEAGIVEITVRVPIALLQQPDATDPLRELVETKRRQERIALAADVRQRLKKTFREWRRRAPREETDAGQV